MPPAGRGASGDLGVAKETIRLLLRVGELDTAFRSEYLERAQAILETHLPRGEFLRLKSEREQLEELTAGARRASESGDWSAVEGLAHRADVLRGRLLAVEDLLRTADAVYGASPVHVSSLAAALNGLGGGTVAGLEELRKGLVESLARLEQSDPARRLFYAERRCHFERSVSHSSGPGEAESGDADGAREVLRQAIEKQDWHRAEVVAHRLAQSREREHRVARLDAGELDRLAEPVPGVASRRAAELGLSELVVPDGVVLREFLCRSEAPTPRLAEQELLLRQRIPRGGVAAPLDSVGGRLAENLDLILQHSFMTSAGIRYLPAFVTETVLVETFDEGVPPPASPLVEVLGLRGRAGRTRLEIELALHEKGKRLLERLGLDAKEFALVCIPYDVYLRLAEQQGWGREQRWTHFDGYQVTHGFHLRALLGGDARYGGAADLCSVGRDYADDHIGARFAVVRRRRLLTALPVAG